MQLLEVDSNLRPSGLHGTEHNPTPPHPVKEYACIIILFLMKSKICLFFLSHYTKMQAILRLALHVYAHKLTRTKYVRDFCCILESFKELS